MNLVDIIIIVYILTMGIIGYKRGVFKELILCLGTILIFYVAYLLKDIVGDFLLLNLPMFDFSNLFSGVITLNILIYQTLAFIIVLAILLVIFKVIVSITGIFEKLLRITIILGAFSKILGFIVGLIEGYVITFIILFFLTQPAFNLNLFTNSKYSNKILNNSPVLTNITQNTVDVINEIYELKDIKDKDDLNYQSLELMLDKKVVKYDTVKKLYDKDKINFNNIEKILEKYKEKND